MVWKCTREIRRDLRVAHVDKKLGAGRIWQPDPEGRGRAVKARAARETASARDGRARW
jgi:hypothetical protein